MDKVLLAVASVVLIANVAMAIPALATDDDNDRTAIELHKEYLADNQADIDDDVIYFASEEYKTAKYANQFLAKAYGRE